MTKSEYTEIIAALGEIRKSQKELDVKVDGIEAKMDKREHLDSLVMENQELMNGNGKPGFKAIRDKVISWENKFNTLALLVAGDIIIQVIRAFK